MRRLTVRTTHEIPDLRPQQLSVGDQVHAGDRDVEWPEFVFVTAGDGTGWFPARHLSQPSGPAVVRAASDATELPTRVGDVLDVVAEDLVSGWLLCRSSSTHEDWVPLRGHEEI